MSPRLTLVLPGASRSKLVLFVTSKVLAARAVSRQSGRGLLSPIGRRFSQWFPERVLRRDAVLTYGCVLQESSNSGRKRIVYCVVSYERVATDQHRWRET